MYIPNFDDVCEAHKNIKDYIHQTPVLTSKSINEIAKCQIFFKCENFQKVGAFKFRGAINAVLSLSQNELKRGVATHSSGNHAQALALAAKILGINATIVMPDNSPSVKKNAVNGYNAEVIYCKPTLKDREETLKNIIQEQNRVFIHPYDNINVIAGQGTAAKELLEEINHLDFIITPIGGGGLLSGTSITTNAINPNIKVIGAEPEGANDAWKSLKYNKLIPSLNPKTICDGLLTSLSERTFEIIESNVNDILLADDNSIIKSMRLIWERMKIIVEPSSAISLAVVLNNPNIFMGSNVGIIISGGNVDLERLPF